MSLNQPYHAITWGAFENPKTLVPYPVILIGSLVGGEVQEMVCYASGEFKWSQGHGASAVKPTSPEGMENMALVQCLRSLHTGVHYVLIQESSGPALTNLKNYCLD